MAATVAMAEGTTLTFTAGGTYTHDITVAGDPFFNIATGQTVTQSGLIADGSRRGRCRGDGRRDAGAGQCGQQLFRRHDGHRRAAP